MLYFDDGAFAFPSRRELEIGANLVYHHFACVSLQMHIGSGPYTSKTECIFFPTPDHFKLPALPSTTLPPDPSSFLPIVLFTQRLQRQGHNIQRLRRDGCL